MAAALSLLSRLTAIVDCGLMMIYDISVDVTTPCHRLDSRLLLFFMPAALRVWPMGYDQQNLGEQCAFTFGRSRRTQADG